MSTNLPAPVSDDSASDTKIFFNEYGRPDLEYPATSVEATIGFFEGKGFDRDAAEITAATLLKQAKLDNIPVFQLLDQLKGFGSVELSALIAEILNNNRPASSALGYRVKSTDIYKVRNVAA